MKATQNPGFAVVALHPHRGFMAISNERHARALAFSEIWIFGEPADREQMRLFQAIMPAACTIPAHKVHRIPNAEMSQRGKGDSDGL